MVRLEIQAAGDARCAAGSDICACAFSRAVSDQVDA